MKKSTYKEMFFVVCNTCKKRLTEDFDSFRKAVNHTPIGTIHNGHYEHYCSNKCYKESNRTLKEILK
jgi:predicted metallo-beta-lactamase superfamily hydrolase